MICPHSIGKGTTTTTLHQLHCNNMFSNISQVQVQRTKMTKSTEEMSISNTPDQIRINNKIAKPMIADQSLELVQM